MTLFPKKNSIFTPKISDDLFFSHRPGFSDFTFLCSIKCRIRAFLHQKNNISEKNSLIALFVYSVRTFARIRQHYFFKYWGTNACMGRPPTSNFGGDRPPQFPLVL